MPAKNTVKVYVDDSFYHVYNRGLNKRVIFLDDQDYKVFLLLIKRYLNPVPEMRTSGGPYPTFAREVELHAYCLMPNHFHLLLYQIKSGGITELLRAITTSYSMYFNKKYNRIGPLFQGKFKASLINTDAYLHHISRYIHLNPAEYESWPYSSLRYYLGRGCPSWLKTNRILAVFDGSPSKYLRFVADYEEQKQLLDELKYELANDP